MLAQLIRSIAGDALAPCEDEKLQPFIDIASARVRRLKTRLEQKGLTEPEFSNLKSWLALHYMALTPTFSSLLVAAETQFENYSEKKALALPKPGVNTMKSTYYGVVADELSLGELEKSFTRRSVSYTFA